MNRNGALMSLQIAIFIVSLASGVDSTLSLHAEECIPVPKDLTLCYGVLHTSTATALPNLAGDETESELYVNSRSWLPLIGTRANMCHPEAQVFLCSVITPICLDTESPLKPFVIPPCRDFCERVRDACEPTLRNFGVWWPIDFRCSRFPVNNGLCFSPNSTHGVSINKGPKCLFCSEGMQRKSLREQFCVSSIVMVGHIIDDNFIEPQQNNITKSVLFGLEHVQRAVQRRPNGRVFLNVTDACGCSMPSATTRRPRYLIFIDRHLDDLTASLVISLDNLTGYQKFEWREMQRSRSDFACNSRSPRKNQVARLPAESNSNGGKKNSKANGKGKGKGKSKVGRNNAGDNLATERVRVQTTESPRQRKRTTAPILRKTSSPKRVSRTSKRPRSSRDQI